MATFSDMATLMLCFFVLLLSFANMDVQNFRSALGSVKEAFGVQFKVRGSFQAMSTSPVELSQNQSSDKLYNQQAVDEESMAIVEEFIRSNGLEAELEVDSDPRGVIVRAKDKVLFDSGHAEIKDQGIPVLIAIGDLFQEFSGTLAIEGHTDNRPIHTPQFPSNWELSGARAASVLRYMVSQDLDLDLVHIAGYADMRPVAPNRTDRGRAANRRVEFVFEHSEEHAADPARAFNVAGLGLGDRRLAEDARRREDESEDWDAGVGDGGEADDLEADPEEDEDEDEDPEEDEDEDEED